MVRTRVAIENATSATTGASSATHAVAATSGTALAATSGIGTAVAATGGTAITLTAAVTIGAAVGTVVVLSTVGWLAYNSFQELGRCNKVIPFCVKSTTSCI